MMPKSDVASIFEHKISKTLDGIFEQADAFAAELTTLLEKYEFKQSYIEEVVPDLVDAYLNEDEKPLWYKENADEVDP